MTLALPRRAAEPYPDYLPLPTGMKRARSGGLRRRSLVWRFRRFLLLVVLMSVVSVSGGAYVFWNNTKLPAKDPPLLETSFICTADAGNDCNQDNAIVQLNGIKRVTVGYDKIPSIFVQALISAEDKDFFRHQGVDPAGVARALVRNATSDGGGQQGGSSIVQQYVKNVYLNDEQSLSRKVTEAALALKLDKELPKQEILERYLNTIYFGRHASSVESASEAYFGKHIQDLGLAESAYLAGLIRSPELLDANRSGDQHDAQRQGATVRRKQVLDSMLAEGYISPAAHDEVAAMGWDYVLPRGAIDESQIRHGDVGTEYIRDYVKNQLLAGGKFTNSQLEGGGLRIYTTIDLKAQEAAYAAIIAVLPDATNDPPSSLVSLDDRGNIRAMVGGRAYGTSPGTSTVNLAIGKEGAGSGRQAGSTFKGLVLAQYLSEGKSLDHVYDAPDAYDTHTLDDKGKDFIIHNYSDGEAGRFNVVDALKHSSNTAFWQIMEETGPKDVAKLAARMGVTADLDPVTPLVFGASAVSVLDMASAYSTFADHGEHATPHIVSKVTNSQGEVLWEPAFEKTPVLSRDVADGAAYALSQVVDSGTGTKAKFGQTAVAGKTGTTDNHNDAWFVGFTCKTTTAVWMGYDSKDAAHPHVMDNVHNIKVTGGTFPAEIFSQFMAKATEGQEGCPPFDRPSNLARETTTSTAPPTTETQKETTTTEGDDGRGRHPTTTDDSTTTTRHRGPEPPTTPATDPSKTTTTTPKGPPHPPFPPLP